MDKDEEKLNKEREQLIQELQKLEQRKNEILIRLAEIQGIFKYLKEKENKQ